MVYKSKRVVLPQGVFPAAIVTKQGRILAVIISMKEGNDELEIETR